MAYQILQGIQISPKGDYNLSRFGQDMVGGSWPQSFAFNGWIYNAECEIGYGSQPTEINVSIVLELSNKAQEYAFFNIKDDDLRCDAGDGRDENLFDIDFNGIKFTDMIMYDYQISLESEVKILTVKFKDYSVILDKIYIGLIKRHGNKYVYSASSRLEFAVICPDCLLAGDSLKQPSYAIRDLDYGSYAGINGDSYDNFRDIKSDGNIYKQWEALFAAKPTLPFFDLNGGFLIIGTEDATEERCGDLAPVSYNFNQLLASLRLRGMSFEGAFPRMSKDTDYFYKQNYIGTLREVLQQWCSDLGYDFYVQGKTFVGINLNRTIDITPIINIVDPNTSIGSEFSLNSNSAILSYKTKSTLDNTFSQAVITASNRPRNIKVHSKSPKRYVGILPLHPIDFNRHSNEMLIRYDTFGTSFVDIAWANNFEINSTDRLKNLPELDNRTFGNIDTCIALTKYEPNLRDIFCQDSALYGESSSIRSASFRALGLVPLVELTDDLYPQAKAICIEAVNGGGGDEINSICLDKQFYRVFLGYSYPKYKEEITRWESLAADSMYKYGIVTRGLLTSYPYMPQNSLIDLSPKSGLYGSQGTSLLRTQHSIEPACNQYFSQRFAPFKDLILYSGLMTPGNVSLPGIPAIPYRTGLFPEGLFYAELNNEWGTSNEDFQKYMSLSLDDPCVQQFQQSVGYTDMVNSIPRKFQDWRLENFTPKTDSNLSQIWEYAAAALENMSEQTLYDRTVTSYYDLHYKQTQACSKLHIIVMTDTRNHPNFNFSCVPKGTSYINNVMLQQYFDREQQAIKRRVETKTPTICDISLIQEMCRNLLSGAFQSGPSGDPKYGCVQDEDKWNWLEDGFTFPHLTRPNSRGLEVTLVKNPISNNSLDNIQNIFKATDINGDFYYSDLANNFTSQQPSKMVYTIVYPISSTVVNGPVSNTPPPAQDPGNNSSVVYGLGGYYRGVLTSNVEVENRTPEIVEIFGEPTSSKNNRAASIKLINNSVDPDLQPQLDPYSSRFLNYMTVITGDSQVITTVSAYHDLVKQLNGYQMLTPTKSVELSLAGSPNNFGSFISYLNPSSGLNKINMSVSDNGVTTTMSFSDRPPHLPKQESILNKILARLK